MSFKKWFFQEDSISTLNTSSFTSAIPNQTPQQIQQKAAKIANTASTMPGMKNVLSTNNPKTQQSNAIDLAAQAEKQVTGKSNLDSSPIAAANNLLKQIKAPLIGQKPGQTNTVANTSYPGVQ